VRNDAWFSRSAVPRPEPVVKGVGYVEKVWSDEARAAALEARRHGYTSSEEPKDEPGRGMTQGFVHPETLHGVNINSHGDWSHSDANGDTKGRGGNGPKSLGARLTRVHGKPKTIRIPGGKVTTQGGKPRSWEPDRYAHEDINAPKKPPVPGSGYSAFNSRGEKVGVTVPGAPTRDDAAERENAYLGGKLRGRIKSGPRVV